MSSLHLYPILDEHYIQSRSLSAANLLEFWRREGISFFQYRAKNLSSRERRERLGEILAESIPRGLRCIVNDDFGLFLSGKGDGFHLGLEDRETLSPAEALLIKKILQGRVHPLHMCRGTLTGVSTHTPEQFAEALTLHERGEFPLSYIAFGPCFPTESKTDGLHPPVTRASLLEVATSVEKARSTSGAVPDLVLIGGIHPDRLAPVLDPFKERGLPQIFLASISAMADPELLRRFRFPVAPT